MTKKKWFYPVCFVLLAALTLTAILLQNRDLTPASFVSYVSAGNPALLIAAVVCMLAYIFFEGEALRVLCKAVGYPRPLGSGLIYSASDIYFSAITPSATGGQPASAVWMMRDGIPGVVTTSILLMNLALYTMAIIVLGAACILLTPGLFLEAHALSKLLIVSGGCVQVAMFVGFWLLVFQPRLLMRIADFVLRALKRLRLMRNAEARRQKLIALEEDYHRCAELFRARPGALIRAFLCNLLQRLSLLLVPVMTFLATGGAPRSIARAFTAQGLVVLGSNSVPLPGGVGVSDYLFMDLFGNFVPDPAELNLLSRGISFYACMLLCALAMLVSLALRKRRGGTHS